MKLLLASLLTAALIAIGFTGCKSDMTDDDLIKEYREKHGKDWDNWEPEVKREFLEKLKYTTPASPPHPDRIKAVEPEFDRKRHHSPYHKRRFR